MITDFSQTALDSGLLAITLSEMVFLKTSQEGYVTLRAQAQELLDDSEELAAVALPATVEEMRDREDAVVASIMEPLSQIRSRVGGDVLPLTIFIMTHCICRGILYTAFDRREHWAPYRQMLLHCLSDVGIEGEAEARKFEQRSLEIVVGEGDDATLADTDRRQLVQETPQSLWERIHERWSEPIAVSGELARMNVQMKEMLAIIADFRQESHEEHREILESLGQLQTQLQARLEAQGVPEPQAKELADTKSPTFMERVTRWARSSKARDGAEAALWAALDFVPAGMTVKLGIKLASAVRRATK